MSRWPSGNTGHRGIRTSLTVAVALLAAGCASSSNETSQTTAAPATTVAIAGTTTVAAEITTTTTTTATTVATTAQAATRTWQRVEGDETCMCADGSDWNLWVREANPEKVVLYFQGGGACFSAEMCNFSTSSTYDRTVTADDDPSRYVGLFNLSHADNPVADWSFVYVPYCTGDVHLGNSTHDYGNGLVVEQNGMVNARFGFEEMVRRFPKATEILVTDRRQAACPHRSLAA